MMSSYVKVNTQFEHGGIRSRVHGFLRDHVGRRLVTVVLLKISLDPPIVLEDGGNRLGRRDHLNHPNVR